LNNTAGRPLFFFFGSPTGDPPKKKKTAGVEPDYVYIKGTLKELEPSYWGLAVAPIRRPLGQTKNTSHISGYIARVYS